jgi:hypothetical protein
MLQGDAYPPNSSEQTESTAETGLTALGTSAGCGERPPTSLVTTRCVVASRALDRGPHANALRRGR